MTDTISTDPPTESAAVPVPEVEPVVEAEVASEAEAQFRRSGGSRDV
jgi:hypothetical protein